MAVSSVNKLSFVAICIGLALGQDAKPDAVGSCGGKFTGRYGRIASPGFPHGKYGNNLLCKYEIEVDPGHVVAYRSMYMDLEPSFLGNCYDWVSIYKSGDDTGSSDSFCGNVIIPDDASTGNKLIVEFKSDVSLVGGGFVLAWSALDLKSMPEIFDCHFDGPLGLCPGWTQAHEDMFDWDIKRGGTIGSYTGPEADHSTGSHLGRYAYMEAAGQKMNDAAILLSPHTKLNRGPQYCLRFWYQNHGVSDSILYVAMLRPDGSAKYIFSQQQDYRSGWREGQITLEGSSESIQIAFEARRGNSIYSTLALDDITLRIGACPEPKTTEMPRTTTTLSTAAISTTTSTWPACDSNRVYRECVPGCDLTCQQHRQGRSCQHSCVNRCACPANQPLWMGNRCVSVDSCPTTSSASPTATSVARRESAAEWISRQYNALVRTVGPERALGLYLRLVELHRAWMQSQRSQQ